MNRNLKAGLQWIAMISIVISVIFIIMGLFYNFDDDNNQIKQNDNQINKKENIKNSSPSKDKIAKNLPRRQIINKSVAKPFDYQEPNMTVQETINNATRTTTVRRIPVR